MNKVETKDLRKHQNVLIDIIVDTSMINLSLGILKQCRFQTYNSGRVGASVCQEKILELSTSTSTFCFVCGQIVADNMKLTHVLEQHVKVRLFKYLLMLLSCKLPKFNLLAK